MKKVCLVTWSDSVNYGTCIQCVALSKTLEKIGFEPYVLSNLRFYSHNEIRELMSRVLRRLIEKIRAYYIEGEKRKYYKDRQKKNRLFVEENTNTYFVKNNKAFYDMNNVMDYFVVGSDQLWNPYHLSLTMFLPFVYDSNKKISYATSVGVSRIPRRKRYLYEKYLNDFKFISVREKTAQLLLNNLLDREITRVVDPVFLLDKEEWMKLAALSSNVEKSGDYFCYFIEKNKDYSAIKELACVEGKKIKTCFSEYYSEDYSEDDDSLMLETGVEDFIGLIRCSDIIFTDSFHAICLSIIFEKQFVAFRRFEKDDKKSQNSRVEDLLKMFGLQDRMYNGGNIEHITSSNIKYEIVNNILGKEKEKAISYLKERLGC